MKINQLYLTLPITLFHKQLQEINTHGYLVRKLSTTYLDVSDKYIMPPVRKLGEMLEADLAESKKLRGKIGADTKKASRELSQILKNQQSEFLTSMRNRRNELEAIYRPIMEHIPEERQRQIEKEVKEVAAKIPTRLIEKRMKETMQIDGIQGTMEDFLDLE